MCPPRCVCDGLVHFLCVTPLCLRWSGPLPVCPPVVTEMVWSTSCVSTSCVSEMAWSTSCVSPATVFLEFWKRRRATLAYDWDLIDWEEEEVRTTRSRTPCRCR